jgi:hypothetical protein
MSNIKEGYKKELFKYYKKKVNIYSIKQNNKDVEEFIKFNRMDSDKIKLIEFYVSTPLILHESYITFDKKYIFVNYKKNKEFDNLEELLMEAFNSDVEELNPFYDMIADSKKYYIEELMEEYNKYKLKNSLKNF